MKNKAKKEQKEPTLAISLIPMISLIVLLMLSVRVMHIDVHIAIFTSAIIAGLVGMYLLNMPWSEIEEGAVDTIKSVMGAILILMTIGMVVASWTVSGIVPTMIYYGLQMISPSWFLLTTLLICSVVAISTGSAWGTVATIGIALMGVGTGLGIPNHIIAGAIISGSYFGDKMSPLSDTTNLAPAVAGTTLFAHIKHMIYTTVPSYLLTCIAFVVLGFQYRHTALEVDSVNQLSAALENSFVIHPALLIIAVVTLVAVAFRVPAVLALFGGAVAGIVVAVVVQGVPVVDGIVSLHYGNTFDTGLASLDDLINGGGMDSMFWTISMILCAMMFGGIMERTGMLKTIVSSILKMVRGTGSLVLATITSCFMMNFFCGEQYLSIVLPGKMFKQAFADYDLDPKNLSRVLEDAGTLSSPLIPWNNCGVYVIAALGIAPWTYVPYCFLNWITPIVSIILGFTGFTMVKQQQK